MTRGNKFLGLVLLAIGALFIAKSLQIDLFMAISFWAAVGFLAAIGGLVSLLKRDFLLSAIWFLIALFMTQRFVHDVFGRFDIFSLAIAVILLATGLSFIFPKDNYRQFMTFNFSDESEPAGKEAGTATEAAGEKFRESAKTDEGEIIRINNLLAGEKRYLTSSMVERLEVSTCLGGTEIFFEKAGLKNDQAVLIANVSLGGLVLHVPANWNVKFTSRNFLGGCSDKDYSMAVSGAPTLVVTGDVVLGGIDVKRS